MFKMVTPRVPILQVDFRYIKQKLKAFYYKVKKRVITQ